MKIKNVIYVVIILALVVVLFSWNSIFPKKPAVTVSDPSTLPGIQTGKTPWQPELTLLTERLSAIGLPKLTAEGSALHIHQHLDLFIDGKSVVIPAGIGIDQAGGFISTIHTHDETGVIHVESPTVETFTLGQFFDIWGVRFTANCIGGYCADDTRTLKVYSNGALYSGDPRTLALSAHEEIAIVYGTGAEAPKTISSTYEFPQGE
jgi:hypothetical protein